MTAHRQSARHNRVSRGRSPAPAPREQRASAVLWAVEVMEALTSLTGVDRAALRLIYWRGMTYTQAARELHLPEQVIRQCVARGMRNLTEHLTTYQPAHQHHE
jgi:DNA-directed RNA polymerase specialized sigma24 family protein